MGNRSLIGALLALFSFQAFALDAFPGAEGYGRNATGGRGGDVCFVTSLLDADPGPVGTFRYCVEESSGPRTVIFRVGGTITLVEDMYVANNGDITIAGQTAPGDGIQLRTSRSYPDAGYNLGVLRFNSSNVIVRYLTIRADKPNINSERYSQMIQWCRDCTDTIFDHISVSWGSNSGGLGATPQGGTGAEPPRTITIQNSLFAEGGVANGYKCGFTIAKNATFYRNICANNGGRNYLMGGWREDPNAPANPNNLQQVNSLIYNWAYMGTKLGCYWQGLSCDRGNKLVGHTFAVHDVINNYFKAGPDTSYPEITIEDPEIKAYVSGNIGPNDGGGQWNMVTYGTHPTLQESDVRVDTKQTDDNIDVVMTAQEAYDWLLVNAGNYLPTRNRPRDTHDEIIIDHIINGTGNARVDDPITTYGANAWPTYSGGPAPQDSDNDGMPDAWETANGLNPNNAADRNGIAYAHYTNLEAYLNELAGAGSPPPEPPPAGDPVPAPWANQDIGTPGNTPGDATFTNGVFALQSSGTDIYGTSDDFHYVYQPLTGDGEISARIASIAAPDFLKSGVMMRNSLDDDDVHYTISTTKVGFYRSMRETKGAQSANDLNLQTAGIPYYARIVRSGDTFTGYLSPNGITWNQVNQETLTMGNTIYIGMVVTSDNVNELAQTQIDNVKLAITKPLPDLNGYKNTQELPLLAQGETCDTGYKCKQLPTVCNQTIAPGAAWSTINQGLQVTCLEKGDHTAKGKLTITQGGTPTADPHQCATYHHYIAYDGAAIDGLTTPWTKSDADKVKVNALEINAPCVIVSGLNVLASTADGIGGSGNSIVVNNVEIDGAGISTGCNANTTPGCTNKSHGVNIGGDGWAIQKSVIHSCGPEHKTTNSGIYVQANKNDVLIVGNEIYDCSHGLEVDGSGVTAETANRFQVENNDFYTTTAHTVNCDDAHPFPTLGTCTAGICCVCGGAHINWKAGASGSADASFIFQNRFYGARLGSQNLVDACGSTGDLRGGGFRFQNFAQRLKVHKNTFVQGQSNIIGGIQGNVQENNNTIERNILADHIQHYSGSNVEAISIGDDMDDTRVMHNTMAYLPDLPNSYWITSNEKTLDFKCNKGVDGRRVGAFPQGDINENYLIDDTDSPGGTSSAYTSAQANLTDYQFYWKLLTTPEQYTILGIEPTLATPYVNACDDVAPRPGWGHDG